MLLLHSMEIVDEIVTSLFYKGMKLLRRETWNYMQQKLLVLTHIKAISMTCGFCGWKCDFVIPNMSTIYENG